MVTQLQVPHLDERYPGMHRIGGRRGAGALMRCYSCGWEGWTCFGHAHRHQCPWKRAMRRRFPETGTGAPKDPRGVTHGSHQSDAKERTTHA